jgi:hypothetical protein
MNWVPVRQRPIRVEAFQLTQENAHAFCEYMYGAKASHLNIHDGRVPIFTKDGPLYANPGDWIIRDAEGELYAVKSQKFETLYERILDKPLELKPLTPEEYEEFRRRMASNPADFVDPDNSILLGLRRKP